MKTRLKRAAWVVLAGCVASLGCRLLGQGERPDPAPVPCPGGNCPRMHACVKRGAEYVCVYEGDDWPAGLARDGGVDGGG